MENETPVTNEDKAVERVSFAVGDAVCFKKARTLPKRMVSSDIQFEKDDLGLAVHPADVFLVCDDSDFGLVLGAFAGAKIDWGKSYYTLCVPREWVTTHETRSTASTLPAKGDKN